MFIGIRIWVVELISNAYYMHLSCLGTICETSVYTNNLEFLNYSVLVHSFVLLAQAITLSTCIIAHNNALLALLVSNNFAEIKSNVFKRVSKENLHNLVYYG